MTDRRPPRTSLALTLALWLAPAVAAAEPAPAEEPAAADPSAEVPAAPDSTAAPAEPAAEVGPSEAQAADDPGADIVPEREASHEDPSTERDVVLVSLDESIKIALRRHPALRAAHHQITVAKTRVEQAKVPYLPRIDVGLQYVIATENGSPASVHGVPGMSRTGGSRRPGVQWFNAFHNDLVVLAIQQVIYDFGRTKNAVKRQDIEVALAELSLAAAEQQIAFGVVQAFYEVQASREMVRVAEDIYVTAQSIRELANAARNVGLKPPSESARAEANVAAAEVALIQARARLQLAKASVAGALGVIDEVFLPERDLAEPHAVADEATNIEQALDSRPELKIVGLQREGLAQDLRRIKAERYPRFDARGSVNSRGQFLPTGGQPTYQQFNWNVGVVISIPIFQGMAIKRRMAEIEAQVDTLDANRELVRQAVTVEVRRARAMVEAADAAVVASQRGVDAARSALETLEGRYREGLAKLVELTDAQATYTNAQRQLVQSTFDRYTARAALDLATGQLP